MKKEVFINKDGYLKINLNNISQETLINVKTACELFKEKLENELKIFKINKSNRDDDMMKIIISNLEKFLKEIEKWMKWN